MPRPAHAPVRVFTLCLTTLAAGALLCVRANADEPHSTWTQFRGPNAAGVSTGDAALPDKIGPGVNQRWKVEVPHGHSSPVIADGRIYLTGYDGRQLSTFALDAGTGRTLWRQVAPHEKLENIHRIGSYATPSVATDGHVVVSFFGSAGMFCYDTDGRLLWHRDLGPFDNQFGACSSPILVDDWIITLQDHDTGSFLAALDKRTGQDVWRTDRSNFRRSYCSPMIWTVDGRRQIVTVASSQVTGYDLATGDYIWNVRGVARTVSATPVVGPDNLLIVAGSGGSDAEPTPSFAEIVANSDKNGNGRIEEAEMPPGSIKRFFDQFDRDKNGAYDEDEYESIREILSMSRDVALAIRPGGEGDITESHIAWEYTRSVPRNASPLVVEGSLYLIKDGGIFTSLNARTGEVQKTGRLPGTGGYFSSPVNGDGKIILASDRGEVTIVTARPEWEVLDKSDFEEPILSSPAIADGRIYLRTAKRLYCFGKAM